jgi:hypothetical protein
MRTAILRDDKRELLWHVIGSLLGVANDRDAEVPDRCDLGTPDYLRYRAPWLRAAAYQAIGQLGALQSPATRDKGVNLLPPLMGAVDRILRDNYDYLKQDRDRIVSLLKRENIAVILQAMHGLTGRPGHSAFVKLLIEILSQPQRTADMMAILKAVQPDLRQTGDLDALMDRLRELDRDSGYRGLDLAPITHDILEWFKQVPPVGQPQSQLKLRAYLAWLLTSPGGGRISPLEELLVQAANQPDLVTRALEGLADHARNGELLDFMQTSKRGFVEIPAATRTRRP